MTDESGNKGWGVGDLVELISTPSEESPETDILEEVFSEAEKETSDEKPEPGKGVEPKVEEPAPPTKGKEAPVEGEKPADESEVTIAKMAKRLAELEAKLAKKEAEPDDEEPDDEEPAEALPMMTEAEALAKLPVVPYIASDQEFNDAFQSKENFNKVLSGVIYKSQLKLLGLMPQIMRSHLQEMEVATANRQSFYGKYPGLLPVADYVQAEATKLASKHPRWSLEKLGDEVAKKVAADLKLDLTGEPTTEAEAEAEPANIKKTKPRPPQAPAGGPRQPFKGDTPREGIMGDMDRTIQRRSQ